MTSGDHRGQKDSTGMVGPVEPSTWWYTVGRIIPWWVASPQRPPPFHPAREPYRATDLSGKISWPADREK